MISLENIQESNKIDSEDWEKTLSIILHSFLLDRNCNTTSYLIEKESLLADFSSLLIKYLKSPYFESKDQKIGIINLIDKLNSQMELLELAKDNINAGDLKTAGQRLGKKSQSAFETSIIE